VHTGFLDRKFGDQSIIMCHYCMRVWPRSHYNTWHLYGHSHGGLEPIGKSMDVGVDVWGFRPIALYEVEVYMSQRPNNFNYLGDRR